MKKKINVLVALALMSLLFASCSSVFTATLTGTVQEVVPNDTEPHGVENVWVCAFLSRSERDSAVANKIDPEETGSIFKGKTDGNGKYSFDVIWSSNSPLFGRTADRVPVYLAFYHEDFGDEDSVKGVLTAAKVDSCNITSEVTNQMTTETLHRIRQTYTITMDIRNYKNTAETVAASNFHVKVFDDNDESLYDNYPEGNEIKLDATTKGVSGKIFISRNDQGAYKQCDISGNGVEDTTTNATFNFKDQNGKVSTNTTASRLYAKSLNYTLNFSIRNIADPMKATTIDAHNFMVKVANSDAPDTIYYNATPEGNTCTFFNKDATDNVTVTISPNDDKKYCLCDEDGKNEEEGKYVETVTFPVSDTSKEITTYGKSLTMPALTIRGWFCDKDGKLSVNRNGAVVTIHENDKEGPIIGTTTTGVNQMSPQMKEDGAFSYTIPSEAIDKAEYDNSTQYEVTYYIEIPGSEDGTVTFTNNPNDPTTKNVKVKSTT